METDESTSAMPFLKVKICSLFQRYGVILFEQSNQAINVGDFFYRCLPEETLNTLFHSNCNDFAKIEILLSCKEELGNVKDNEECRQKLSDLVLERLDDNYYLWDLNREMQTIDSTREGFINNKKRNVDDYRY